MTDDVVDGSSWFFRQRRESGVSGGNDPILPRLLDRRRLSNRVVRVEANLVNRGGDTGVGEEGSEVRFVVV